MMHLCWIIPLFISELTIITLVVNEPDMAGKLCFGFLGISLPTTGYIMGIVHHFN